ncbi:MAG: DUF434 domain-containing protein [Myxococcota bacterium]
MAPKQGFHPNDPQQFAPDQLHILHQASADMNYLRTRDYADESALKLVGDRYQLSARQRRAIRGASCSDPSLIHRRNAALSADAIAGRTLWIDGYNLLITLTTARAGGPLIRGRAGALRDLAGLHSGYRPDTDTPELLALIQTCLQPLGVHAVHWSFDRPISKSGQLARLIHEEALAHGWPWTAETVPDPDPLLRAAPADHVLVTSDAGILDNTHAFWFDLTGYIISHTSPQAWIVDWWTPAIDP